MTAAALITDKQQETPGSVWDARLALRVAGSQWGSRLTHANHEGPLYVQKPFYPEGADHPHIYLLHPPGGIVSGDSLTLKVSLEDAARLLITTPGCNRLYRARTDAPDHAPLKQRVHTELSVQDQCVLEWFPMETIVFDGASIDLRTDIHLQQGAMFCGWEIVCLGLPACQTCFATGDILQSFTLYREQRPLLIDRLQLDAGCGLLSARCGMAAQPVSGLFVVGPLSASAMGQAQVEALLDTLRTTIAQRGWQDTLAVTRVNDLLIIRYLGAYADEARDAFTVLWQILRPALLQREAVLPRIWAT